MSESLFKEHLCWLLLNFLQNFLKIIVKKIISQQSFSQKILRNYFLVLDATFLKITPLQVSHGFCLSLNVRSISRTQSNIMMELFAKIINGSRGVFRMESNIEDGAFCVNSKRLKQWMVEKNFLKKLHLRCWTPF